MRSRALQVESRHRVAAVAAMLRQTVGGRDDFGIQRRHKLAGEIPGKPSRMGRKAGAPPHRVTGVVRHNPMRQENRKTGETRPQRLRIPLPVHGRHVTVQRCQQHRILHVPQ